MRWYTTLFANLRQTEPLPEDRMAMQEGVDLFLDVLLFLFCLSLSLSDKS